MNKQDLSYLRKGFKLDSPLVTISNISTTYIKKETGEVLVSQLPAYAILNNDVQELYLKNVKKLMSGKINVNVFNLDFNEESQDRQELLFNLVRNENDFEDNCNELLGHIVAHYNFNTDIVVNIVRFSLNLEENTYNFMACSISKIKNTQREFICDLRDGDFSTQYPMNPVIAITTPTDGFVFPSMEEQQPDVDHVINYTASKNNLNTEFVSEVIKAVPILSVQQERDLFLATMQEIFDGHIEYTKLNNIYTKIKDREDFGDKINVDRIENILNEESENMEEKIAQVLEEKVPLGYEFTIANIVPDFTYKSFLLNNDQMDLKIQPECLDDIECVTENNQLYLKVKLKENLKSYGLDLTANND